MTSADDAPVRYGPSEEFLAEMQRLFHENHDAVERSLQIEAKGK